MNIEINNSKAVVAYSDGNVVLFSYGVPVAAFIPGRGYLRTAKKWSMTTTRHINDWLKKSGAETVEVVEQDAIDNLSYNNP